MVHTNSFEERRAKKALKGTKNKVAEQNASPTRRKRDAAGGIVADEAKKPRKPRKTGISQELQIEHVAGPVNTPSITREELAAAMKEIHKAQVIERENGQDQEKSEESDSKALESVDSIEFSNGKNTLTIRYSKRFNRLYRLQIFLNGEMEIRPVTYSGARTGMAFWNLLKGALKT